MNLFYYSSSDGTSLKYHVINRLFMYKPMYKAIPDNLLSIF